MSERARLNAGYSKSRAAAGLLIAGLLILMLASCAAPSGEAAGENETSTEAAPDTVRVEEITQGEQTSNIDIGVAGPAQVNVREITIPPGLSTGEHCHYGNLIGVVHQGTLTHYAPIYPDGVHEYHTGDSLVEGPGYIHEGRNEGSEDVILWVTYVTPLGDPLAESELAKCDASPS